MSNLASKRREFSLFSRFAQDRVVFYDNLACPVRLLYNEHVEWAEKKGLPALDAGRFMECLRETGVTIKGGGTGKLKRVANGIGVKPK